MEATGVAAARPETEPTTVSLLLLKTATSGLPFIRNPRRFPTALLKMTPPAMCRGLPLGRNPRRTLPSRRRPARVAAHAQPPAHPPRKMTMYRSLHPYAVPGAPSIGESLEEEDNLPGLPLVCSPGATSTGNSLGDEDDVAGLQ